jgi:hypothetical protein
LPPELDDAYEDLGAAGRALRDTVAVVSDMYARICLWADSLDELEARRQRVIDYYDSLNITVHAPANEQLRLHAEAMPGGKVRRNGPFKASYPHRALPSTLAGSMCLASSQIGDGFGLYIGDADDQSAVHLDPHHAAQVHNRPTAIGFTGEPGGGKSYAANYMTLQAALRGFAVVSVDPGNATGRLAAWARQSGLLDPHVVTLGEDSGDAGTLDPFGMADTAGERADLALSTATILLPAADARQYELVIAEACQSVAERRGGSMYDLADLLRSNTDPAVARLGAGLTTIAKSPLGRLCFGVGEHRLMTPRRGWTILQVQGLETPPVEVSRSDYDPVQRRNVALTFLIATLATRTMNRLDRAIPKLITLDEVWALAGTPQGRRLLDDLVRQARKANTVAFLISQSVGDLLSETVEANLGARFAFRVQDPVEIDKVLRAHRLPVTDANRRLVRSLPNGKALYTDPVRTGTVQFNAVFEKLIDALNTTPGRERVSA